LACASNFSSFWVTLKSPLAKTGSIFASKNSLKPH
jgi:hypothetical protein